MRKGSLRLATGNSCVHIYIYIYIYICIYIYAPVYIFTQAVVRKAGLILATANDDDEMKNQMWRLATRCARGEHPPCTCVRCAHLCDFMYIYVYVYIPHMYAHLCTSGCIFTRQ